MLGLTFPSRAAAGGKKAPSCAKRLLLMVNIEHKGDPGGGVQFCMDTLGGFYFADTGKYFLLLGVIKRGDAAPRKQFVCRRKHA